jgi:hypothetical protein
LDSTDFSVKPSANSVAVPSAKVYLTKSKYYFSDFLKRYQTTEIKFTTGFSKDGIEYTTA